MTVELGALRACKFIESRELILDPRGKIAFGRKRKVPCSLH